MTAPSVAMSGPSRELPEDYYRKRRGNTAFGILIRSSDPVTDRLVDLFHPRQQRWQDHFTWDERFELIIGLTATGRITVDALKLNQPELVNLRRLLYAAGEHPLSETKGDG